MGESVVPLGSIWMSARSVSESVPTTFAGNSRPLERRTRRVCRRPSESTTWWFVMMWPSALTTTPEPMPRDCHRSPWAPTCVVIWTTEGLTFSATWASASWNAERSAETGLRSAACAAVGRGSNRRPSPMPAAMPPARKTATRAERIHTFIDLLVLPGSGLDLDGFPLSGPQDLDLELRLAHRAQHFGAELEAIR